MVVTMKPIIFSLVKSKFGNNVSYPTFQKWFMASNKCARMCLYLQVFL